MQTDDMTLAIGSGGSQMVVSGLLLAAAVGSGVVGGIFFAFSTFIMRALDRVPAAAAVASMQSINVTVINPLFLAVFFGTALLSALLAGVGHVRFGGVAGMLMLGGAAVYLIGSILVTIVFNVPGNDRLASASRQATDLAREWAAYRGPWTAWNHVRTIASIAASSLFVAALRFLPAG